MAVTLDSLKKSIGKKKKGIGVNAVSWIFWKNQKADEFDI